MKFCRSLLAAGAFLLLGLPDASAHITLRVPMPRTVATTGQKGPPPCGNMGPAKPNEYRPGESIMVQWSETIPHPGRFRIAFGPAGTMFPNPMTQKDTNTTLPIFLDGLFPKTGNGGAGMHQQMITFPSTPCDACTLQVLQVMKVNPPYAAGADQDIYYQCADIVLKGAPMGGSDGGTAPDGATGMDAMGTGGSGGSGGTGGSGGSGGSSGTGGSSGSVGTGGGGGSSSSGGSGGSTGGSTGTGGSSGGSTGGSGSGGSGGSGSSGRGGNAGSGTGGSGTTTPPAQASSPLGCSVSGGQPSVTALGFAALLVGLALRGRRRRR